MMPKREAIRKAMREPYRSMRGHFRHEVGHYCWDRLVQGTPWMDGFHPLFGDETLDHSDSLKRNYEPGPPADWPMHFVGAYASTHPWEDWAECWAPQADHFPAFLNHWTRLTTLLSEMSRSMGQPDCYPFVLPRGVAARLHFIHLVVISRSWLQDQSQDQAQMQTQSPPSASRAVGS